MPRAKKVATKKKIKQAVSVNVVVNSNNRRKTVSSKSAQQQPQTVYIPSGSQATPTVILTQQPQPHPTHNTDVSSHVEALVKKYSAPEKTLLHKSEPEKTLTETAKEPVKADVPGVAVKVEHERVLTPKPVKHEHILQPRRVINYDKSPMQDAGGSETESRGTNRTVSHHSFINSDSERETRSLPNPGYPRILRGQALMSEASVQTEREKRNRAGQISMLQFFNAHDIPVENTNLSAMKAELVRRNLLDAYYAKPKGKGKK